MDPLTVAQFRSDFPEFADPVKYPTALISFWLALVQGTLQNSARWGALLIQAQELMLAHYVTLAARDLAAAATGNPPGEVAGVVTASSVGPVSVTYDVDAITDPDPGNWNATGYGQRYWKLARMFGAGGLQI